MADNSTHICIVEDDGPVREALARLLVTLGHGVSAFRSAEEFEENPQSEPCGCLLLDVRLPGLSGIALHERLRKQNPEIPVVFMTGHGDVPLAVEAMKKGAVDFLIKPVDETVLINAVEKALEVHAAQLAKANQTRGVHELLDRLTPRERDVLREMVTGAQNKQIADRLGIALKTVKIHRGRVMAKMEVGSVVELAREVDQMTDTDFSKTPPEDIQA
jgi:FixJ family two-component response regulator